MPQNPYIYVILLKVSLDAENFLPIFFGQMNESKYYIYKDAKEIAMSDMIKLRQRFCKDCDIPVNIFDEPYFSDRLKLFDFLYNSISKWDLFKSELAKYDSAMDYFADYSRRKMTNSSSLLEIDAGTI